MAQYVACVTSRTYNQSILLQLVSDYNRNSCKRSKLCCQRCQSRDAIPSYGLLRCYKVSRIVLHRIAWPPVHVSGTFNTLINKKISIKIMPKIFMNARDPANQICFFKNLTSLQCPEFLTCFRSLIILCVPGNFPQKQHVLVPSSFSSLFLLIKLKICAKFFYSIVEARDFVCNPSIFSLELYQLVYR